MRESYSDVRELLLHFRTRTNTEDIEPALATTLQKFEHQSGIPTHLNIQGQGMPLSPDLQIQVLHIVQEALSNVRKHARASRVDLTLDYRAPETVALQLSDNGVGAIASADAASGFGLLGLEERARQLGGSIQWESARGKGYRLTIELPAEPPKTVAMGQGEAA